MPALALLSNPKLLLLDEPTAGVDPQARREFWDSIHALSDSGVTVLVSTHYMDEAERCHRIVYIMDGVILADGTIAELLADAGLHTFTVHAPHKGLATLLEALPRVRAARPVVEKLPGVVRAQVFGDTLHVTGTDRAALLAAIEPLRADGSWTWTEGETSLEDLFIHLAALHRRGAADAR